MKWCMLPILAESRAQMCKSLSGRFIGDPTYEYEYIDVKVVGEGEEAEEETNTVSLETVDEPLNGPVTAKIYLLRSAQ